MPLNISNCCISWDNNVVVLEITKFMVANPLWTVHYLTTESLTGSIERDGGWERDGAMGNGGSCHCLAVAI